MLNKQTQLSLILYLLTIFLNFEILYPASNITKALEVKYTSDINGTIVDSMSGNPVELASIVLLNKKDLSVVKGITTDKSGYFSIAKISDGNYLLRVSFIGYRNKKISISVNKATKQLYELGTIFLIPVKITTGEVHVTAEKERVVFDKDKIIFNVDKDIASLGGSAVEVLENAPMVMVDFEGNASIIGRNNTSIYIDGISASNMGMDSKDILKTISSRDIERIEIIENPGPEYGAETSGGVLNIILKKKGNSSVNASADINASTKNSFNPSANFSMMDNKYAFRASIFSSYSENKIHSILNRETVYHGSSALLYQDKNRFTKNLSNSLMSSFLYNLNKNNNISTYVSYRFNNSDYSNDFMNSFSFNNSSSETYNNTSMDENGGRYLALSTTYQKQFEKKGQRFSSTLSYFRNKLESNTNSHNSNMNLTEDLEKLKNNSNNLNNSYILKADYCHPLNEKRSISFFFNSSWKDLSMVNDYYVLINNVWQTISTNKIYYSYFEKKYSLSGAYEDEYAGVNVELAPGVEFLRIRGGDFGIYSNYSFTNFYPDVRLFGNLNKENSLHFAYMRKILYPMNKQLNPRKDYRDSSNVIMGNPDLKPAIYDGGYIEYRYNALSTIFSTALRYSKGKDLIEDYTYALDKATTITTYKNIAENNTYNLKLSIDQSFGKWLKLNSILNVNKTEYKNTSNNGNKFDWTLFANSNISLDGYYFQIKLMYKSPSNTAQRKTGEICFVDFAAKKSLFENKLALYLRIKDVFNLLKDNSRVYGNGLYSYSSNSQTTRIIMAGITYFFQATKESSNIKDATTNEDEDDF